MEDKHTRKAQAAKAKMLAGIKRRRSELITVRITPGLMNMLRHMGQEHGTWNCGIRSPRTVAYHLMLKGITAVLKDRDLPELDISRVLEALLEPAQAVR